MPIKLLRTPASTFPYSTMLTFVLVPVVFAQEPQRLEKIEITGSSIKGIAAETALPVGQ